MPNDFLTIDVEGFEALAVHFDSLAEGLRSEILKKATLEAAKAVETELLARTPINTDGFTAGSDRLAPGELLADIDVRPFSDAAKGSVAFAVGPGAKTAHVANFVEYGHRMVTGGYSRVTASGKVRGPGKVGGFVPAYPFIRPSQDAAEPAALAAFEAALQSEVKARE